MKGIAALAAVGVAALAVRRYLSQQEAMSAVPRELRSPLLPYIPNTDSRRTLPLFRFNSRIPTLAGRGVTVTKRAIGDPGRAGADVHT